LAPTVTTNAAVTNRIAVSFELTAASGSTALGTLYNWLAGTWVVRLNVTTANANITWTECYICQVNSGCASVATIGSVTGQSISLGTTGVKSMNVTGSAISPASTDGVEIILAMTNGGTMTQSFGFTPNQLIDSPFTAAAVAFVRPTNKTVLQAVNRSITW
jgi:hypothetical protein